MIDWNHLPYSFCVDLVMSSRALFQDSQDRCHFLFFIFFYKLIIMHEGLFIILIIQASSLSHPPFLLDWQGRWLSHALWASKPGWVPVTETKWSVMGIAQAPAHIPAEKAWDPELPMSDVCSPHTSMRQLIPRTEWNIYFSKREHILSWGHRFRFWDYRVHSKCLVEPCEAHYFTEYLPILGVAPR